MNRPKSYNNYYKQLVSAIMADNPSRDEKDLIAYSLWLNKHYDVYLQSQDGKSYFTKTGKPYVLVRFTGEYKEKKYYEVYLKEAKSSKISPINISLIKEHGKPLDIHDKDKDLYNDIRALLIDYFKDDFNNVPRETLAECKSIESL
ncbi:MAG: hypothetical protein J6Y28_07920 [Acholeplasmatales bacterium]|nr:hypothetical protein [Acholeplasmatales bacterium]